MNSDENDFYIGEHPSIDQSPNVTSIQSNKFGHDSGPQPIVDQKGQTTEIGINENDDQETEKSEYKIASKFLLNCALSPTNMKRLKIKLVEIKLLKIANRLGHPHLHFEIDGKMYFYEIHGIKVDYKIVLRCQKKFLKSTFSTLLSRLKV